MPGDSTAEPVQLPAPGGRSLRWTVGGIVGLVGLMQVAIGVQVGRAGPVVGGVVLLALAAALAVGAGRGTVVGRGGIHAPHRLRERQLPWSTITALRTVPAANGRIQLLVEREGRPPEAAVRVAVLRPADAERLLPAVRAVAADNEVAFHDGG